MPSPEPLLQGRNDTTTTSNHTMAARNVAPDGRKRHEIGRNATQSPGFDEATAALSPDRAEKALRPPSPLAGPGRPDAREEARLTHEVLPKLRAMGQVFETRRADPANPDSALLFFNTRDPGRTFTARTFGPHAEGLLHETLRFGGEASLKAQLAKLEAFPLWLAQHLYVPDEKDLERMLDTDLHRLVRLAQTAVHGGQAPTPMEAAFAAAGQKAQPFVKAGSVVVQWVSFLLAGGALSWSIRLREVLDMAFDTAELAINVPSSNLNPVEQAVRAFEPPPLTLSNLGPKQRILCEVAYFKPAIMQILMHRFCRNHGVKLSFVECGQWAPRVNVG
jgi:hypothetical protein